MYCLHASCLHASVTSDASSFMLCDVILKAVTGVVFLLIQASVKLDNKNLIRHPKFICRYRLQNEQICIMMFITVYTELK